MFTKTLSLLLLPALAVAQYGYTPPDTTTAGGAAASPTTAALPAAPSAPTDTAGHMNVDVAFQGGFVFNPPNINASIGTLVTFWFPSSDIKHSVTQSTFQNPCTYLAANTSAGTPAGFDSSLLSASNFTINITDSNPIWYFCKQITHCGIGMVGSINAPATGDTYDAFRSAALALNGSEVTTPDNGPVLGGVNANTTGPPVSDISTSGAMKITTSIGFALFAAVVGVVMV